MLCERIDKGVLSTDMIRSTRYECVRNLFSQFGINPFNENLMRLKTTSDILYSESVDNRLIVAIPSGFTDTVMVYYENSLNRFICMRYTGETEVKQIPAEFLLRDSKIVGYYLKHSKYRED